MTPRKSLIFLAACFVFCKADAQWTTTGGNETITTGNVAIGSPSVTNFLLTVNKGIVTNTVAPLAIFGYSTIPSNRSIVFEQLGNASTATQYFFLNGGLGGQAVLGSPTLTSIYAPSFGLECSDANLSILTAPAGTDITPVRAMSFLPGGNVLIGKTSQVNSGYVLDVNGNVRANEVVVNSTGADYVFDAGYKLPSLRSLKGYIRVNHHLPGIQSATEMQKGGVDVGENQRLLLEKVEQLTLYIMQQDKKIAAQQKRIERLEQASRQRPAKPMAR